MGGVFERCVKTLKRPKSCRVINYETQEMYPLQACDYLADVEAIETVCKYLGERLFEACPSTLQHRRVSDSNDEPLFAKGFHQVEYPRAVSM